ncbi:uncharacterized protein LOC111378016 [Olea europaea var. sylvestris]|uniref:uncharacterized protein LOC111378016 n=1 Tax=Olea europaea var. sylvestris TaxID=158386 RepID=UPI000C1D6EF2|nr:uncharacterized protein LOC111378016 [Olea europaea var. sylvestris]
MEVYADDMLVKSLEAGDHVTHLNNTFQILKMATIKGQALADFVAEFANLPEVDEIMENAERPTWNLFVDGSAGDTGSGAEVVLISPEGHKLNSAMRFGFKVTNNVGEYEAILASLRLAREMQVKRLLIRSESQLVVSQVNGNFSARDKTMASYLKTVMNLVPSFEKFELIQIPRIENAHADTLSKLASSKDSELLTVVLIEHLLIPSTEASNVILQAKEEVIHFLFIDDVLYKRSFSFPLLRCMGGEEATYILREVHEEVCGNHSRGLSLAQKILRQGYYWPTMKKDTLQFVRKCDKYQRFSPIQRQPSQDLTTVFSPWPFLKWGMDLIGPLPKGRRGTSFAIVANDYFTKWVEVEPLTKITKANTSKFLWKNIICQLGIPHSIISNNDKQFDNKKVKTNGEVEAMNKTIKHVLKRKLDVLKGAWVGELPQVLWAIRTTTRTPTGEIPFSWHSELR